jgi:hypothetical protein
LEEAVADEQHSGCAATINDRKQKDACRFRNRNLQASFVIDALLIDFRGKAVPDHRENRREHALRVHLQ